METRFRIKDDLAGIPSVEERRALIDRVAHSSQFSRSARLRDFLQYVGYGSLESGGSEIHEHTIGVHVFGRSPDYDRSQDNIVRVNASELRKRIDRYFETEGAEETLTFSIPRGGYIPLFQWREAPTSSAIALPEAQGLTLSTDASLESVAKKPVSRKLPWAWLCVTFVLVTVCCIQWWQNRALRILTDTWAGRPVVSEFWTSFVAAAPETHIILPDASVTMSEEITHKQLSLWDYIHRDFPGSAHGSNMSADRQRDLDTIFGHNIVTLGDFAAAQQFLALSPIAPSFHLSLARFFEADSINHANMIIIGGRKANPWTALFDEKLNFGLEDSDEAASLCVVNRHPLASESARLCPSIGQNYITAYSVVAFVPNPGRTGKVLLLGGTDSDATAAAAQFMTSTDGLNDLKAQLHSDHIGYFEAVLKNTSLRGAPFRAQLLSIRAQ
ncbi:hypothetical protein [Silvibacterium dinghuense]|uniref:hypothetical protein n=1 Tax=Silvibacterium dinghuense TaxID=1560006 RepID=UPI0013E94879|nr:hypothetical protein [Silvibacterium dinghuense]